MDDKDLQLLKSSMNKVVRITCHDGEVVLAKVRFVFEEYEDVVFDLVSTNRESKYEKHDEQPAYAIDLQNIKSVELVPEPPTGTGSTAAGSGGQSRESECT